MIRIALGAALLAALAACRAPPLRAVVADHSAPDRSAPPAAPAPDADWHDLVIAPFGSVLKDIPAALHEVLLFRDEAPADGPAKDGAAAAECYATDAAAPRLVGRIPDEYLLCLRQDRLARIQASVRLPAAEAPEVFAAACASWVLHAAPGAAPATAPGAAACEGRDGTIRFRGRLEEEEQGESTLSIILDDDSNP